MTANVSPQPEDIQALFNRIAPVYDRLNQELSWGLHRIWKQMAASWADPQPGDCGLDLCCGSGDLALLLARRVGKTGKVVGVDFSAQQLAIARQNAARCFPPPAVEWVESDVLTLPFDSNKFDCATMGYGLRNVVDIPRCLSELHRVLNPGARAAILDFHQPDNPLLQAFQQWYLDTVVVPTAQRYQLREEYAYIAPSLDRFVKGPEQESLALAAGFARATHYPISGGMMGVLVLEKS